MKNPLSPVEHPGGVGVNCEMFELGIEQFVVSNSLTHLLSLHADVSLRLPHFRVDHTCLFCSPESKRRRFQSASVWTINSQREGRLPPIQNDSSALRLGAPRPLLLSRVEAFNFLADLEYSDLRIECPFLPSKHVRDTQSTSHHL